MLVDVIVVALLLAIGNVLFWHFDPFMPLWRRALKFILIVSVAAAIDRFFGRTALLAVGGVGLAAFVYVHGIWLPRHGVNGWTGEPRAKYFALRGWEWPENK